jgi:glucose-1-phosphate adenylyltransferase
MGNYIFRTAPLLEALETDAKLEASMHDFGRDMVPWMVNSGKRCSRLRLSHQNRVPGEEPGQPRTGATSGPSTRTGRRRWTSSPSSRRSTCTTALADPHGHEPRPAGEVRVPRRGQRASASPRRAWCRSAASSRAVASTAACCRRVRVNSFSRDRRERAVRERGHRAPRRIRRAIIDKDVEIPAGTRDRLRPGRGPQEVVRERGRDRGDPEAREGGLIAVPRTIVVGDVHGPRTRSSTLSSRRWRSARAIGW